MSCNGCRVLRKGCSDDCVIRPCLEWIKSPESQANATIFLAKFYGRVGLINLINTGPHHLRPAIFRSLLYEACGRIINPIHGAVGLLWTGNWRECQSAVDSVLKGSATFITNTALDSKKPFPALEPYHVMIHQPNMMKRPTTHTAALVIGRGRVIHEGNVSPRAGHRSSGAVNGAVKLELTLGGGGVGESSPVDNDDPLLSAEADHK